MNSDALERTIEALGGLGRLEDVDAALIALCRSTAKAVDDCPSKATLVGEYRECLVLWGSAGEGGTDAFEDLMARINARTEVGDASEG
jgi:hypothetical protein